MQEQVVLANKCLDKNLLDFYDKKLGDMHAFVASKMFPQLADKSLDEIKKNHKEERQESKIAGFVIIFGGTEKNIAEQLNKSDEDARRTVESYFEAFPDLKDYFDKKKQEGVKNGYILIDEITGRKSYIESFKEFKQLERSMDSLFWEKYKQEKQKFNKELPNNFEKLKDKVSRYFRIKGAIERKSLNYPIQGCAASITKTSGIFIFKWIKENNLLNIVKFVNQVHDENILECPEELGTKVADAVKKAMIDAGNIFCKRVPLEAEPEISKIWKK